MYTKQDKKKATKTLKSSYTNNHYNRQYDVRYRNK